MTITLWLCCLWCCGFGAALSDIAGVSYGSVAAGGVAGYYVAVETASYVLVEFTVMVLVVMALLVAVVVDIGGGCNDRDIAMVVL